MANLVKHPIGKYSIFSRIIFWAQKKKYGEILEPTWYWGRSPSLLVGLQVFYRCLDRKKNPLNPALRALVSNHISQLNHCAFCSDISASTLQKKGVSPEKIDKLSEFRSDPLFSQAERVALEYAEAVTLASGPLSSDHFLELKKFFSEDEIVELTAWICFQNLSSKFNAALDIPAQGFCRLR